MTSSHETLLPVVYHCYHCGSEATDSSFKYFDNKKVDQPRHQCHHCHKFFTLGSRGRPQGKTYAKKRNEDPEALKNLSRQCRHCGVADHALFKYYNNNNLSQPRFKCLSCGNQFQMRLLGTGEERHLVHTSSQQTRAPYRRKQCVPEPFPNASSSSEDGSYQLFDGSFMPMPSYQLMPLEPGTRLLSEMSDEDTQYSNFLEAELVEEENIEVDPLSWTTNGNLPPPLSDEFDEYLHFVECELLTEEYSEALNVDAFTSTANVGSEFPPAWSNEDAELTDFIEANVMALDGDMISDHMAEMVSESTSSSMEVMYGTLAVDRPTVSDSDSWSHNDTSVDPFSMSYVDAAAASCYQMDMDMTREDSVVAEAAVQSIGSECSSSSAVSTMVFADSFHVIPEPLLVQQALKEDEQCSDFHWNEDDEAEDDTGMSSWTY